MPTSSIFHEVKIDTEEKAKLFCAALKKAEKYARAHKNDTKVPVYTTLEGDEIKRFFEKE